MFMWSDAYCYIQLYSSLYSDISNVNKSNRQKGDKCNTAYT